jgi:hypothetical protein
MSGWVSAWRCCLAAGYWPADAVAAGCARAIDADLGGDGAQRGYLRGDDAALGEDLLNRLGHGLTAGASRMSQRHRPGFTDGDGVAAEAGELAGCPYGGCVVSGLHLV